MSAAWRISIGNMAIIIGARPAPGRSRASGSLVFFVSDRLVIIWKILYYLSILILLIMAENEFLFGKQLENADAEPSVPALSVPDEPATKKSISRRKLLIGAGALGAAWGADKLVRRGGYDAISGFLYKKFGHKNYEQPLARVIENLKLVYPEIDQWINSKDWAEGIAEACAKNNVEPTIENLGMILTLVSHESGFRTSPRVIDAWATPFESVVKATGLVQPRTSGPMELSNRYIMVDEKVSYEEAVKRSSTIKGGLFYGVRHLKRLQDTYAAKPDKHEIVLQSIFADYNAGPFASRNAGLQRAVNELSGSRLREDGLLLLPKDKQGKAGESQTQKAIFDLFQKQNITISKADIEQDLNLQLSSDLEKTETWKIIQKLSQKDIPLVPADRPVLGAVGVAKKAISGIGNSREYSVARMKEFEEIIKLANKEIK